MKPFPYSRRMIFIKAGLVPSNLMTVTLGAADRYIVAHRARFRYVFIFYGVAKSKES